MFFIQCGEDNLIPHFCCTISLLEIGGEGGLGMGGPFPLCILTAI